MNLFATKQLAPVAQNCSFVSAAKRAPESIPITARALASMIYSMFPAGLNHLPPEWEAHAVKDEDDAPTCAQVRAEHSDCMKCRFGSRTRLSSTPMAMATPGSPEYARWLAFSMLLRLSDGTVTKEGKEVIEAALFDPETLRALAALEGVDLGTFKGLLRRGVGRAFSMRDFNLALEAARLEALAASGGGDRLDVDLAHDYSRVLSICKEALSSSNLPHSLFRRGPDLVRIRRDEKGKALIVTLTKTTLRQEMADHCRFHKRGRPCSPPASLIEDIMNAPDLELPVLDALVHNPVIRSDGSISQLPGYDAQTRTWYEPPPGHSPIDLPPEVTDADVREASATLSDVFCDFRFADDASYANVIALMLTLVLRPAIPGCVPMTIITAPKEGSGKGLISDVIAIIAFGEKPPVPPIPQSKAEWSSFITSQLATGASAVRLDNFERGARFSNATFAGLLTGEEWIARKFHSNTTMLRFAHRTIWFGTGNNVMPAGDMVRRVVPVFLDTRSDNPSLRPSDSFKHHPLDKYVAENRALLLRAVFILIISWFNKGRPSAPKAIQMGSFETWCSMVAGILHNAGIPGFLGNLVSLHTHLDDPMIQWRTFLPMWFARYDNRGVTVSEFFADLLADGQLRAVLPEDLSEAIAGRSEGAHHRVGRALLAKKDLVAGDYQLVTPGHDKTTNTRRWQVLRLEAERGSTAIMAVQ